MCLLLRVYIGVGGGWEKLDWRGNDCGGAGEWLWRSKREDRVGGGGGGGESHDDCCLKSWLKRSKVSSGHLLCRSLSLYIYICRCSYMLSFWFKNYIILFDCNFFTCNLYQKFFSINKSFIKSPFSKVILHVRNITLGNNILKYIDHI